MVPVIEGCADDADLEDTRPNVSALQIIRQVFSLAQLAREANSAECV